MKRFFFIVTSIFLLFSQLFAQGVKKGNVGIDLGIGLGLHCESTDKGYGYDNWGGIGLCSLIPIYVSYAVANNLSAGIDFERNGYYYANDNNSYFRLFNFGNFVTFRILNKEKNLLYIEGIVNYSYLSAGNTNTDDKVHGSGLNIQAGLGYKHFFGNYFGYFISAAFANYKYNEIIDQNGFNVKLYENLVKYEYRLCGANIRTGLCFKF
ncbi:MAG: hypothetical protein WC868_12485 [Bacteroidales bacterium]